MRDCESCYPSRDCDTMVSESIEILVQEPDQFVCIVSNSLTGHCGRVIKAKASLLAQISQAIIMLYSINTRHIRLI